MRPNITKIIYLTTPKIDWILVLKRNNKNRIELFSLSLVSRGGFFKKALYIFIIYLFGQSIFALIRIIHQ